jgi:hypothetical protein
MVFVKEQKQQMAEKPFGQGAPKGEKGLLLNIVYD